MGAVVGAQFQEAESDLQGAEGSFWRLTPTLVVPQQTLDNAVAAAAAELQLLLVTLIIITSLYHLPLL